MFRQQIKEILMSLYENIRKRRKKVAAGTVGRMRKKGEKGAPSDKDFKNAAKTAKKPKKS
jgi:hypothetical protein